MSKKLGPIRADVQSWLSELRAAGVNHARVRDGDFEIEVDLEPLAPVPLAPAGFVDKDGKAVDLDEGNPWRDDEPEGDPMLAANFPAKTDA